MLKFDRPLYSKRKYIPLFLCCLSFIFLNSGCTRNTKTYVLIIAIDQLNFSSARCAPNISVAQKGFAQLCSESVRHTHAFTVSPLSLPSLTTLMTSLFPFEHGLKHSNSHSLSEEFLTSPEVAIKKGWRTSFFSGGAPVLRKSGLNQGFEVFDDDFTKGIRKNFRTLNETSKAFFEWIDSDVGDEPFFSVLYIPELLHRNLGFLSDDEDSLENETTDSLDESLGEFFAELKKRKLWLKTNLFVVGLNGSVPVLDHPTKRWTELTHQNLQIELFIKNASQEANTKPQWKSDSYISLVDVSNMIYKLLDPTKPATSEHFQSETAQKLIPTETSWFSFMGLGSSHAGLFVNQQLLWFSQPPMILNGLIDSLSFQISTAPSSVKPQLEQLAQLGYQPWNPQQKIVIDESHWLAQENLEKRDWSSLQSMAKQQNQKDWDFVAESNLSPSISARAIDADSCLKLLVSELQSEQSKNLKLCADPGVISLFEYYNATSEKREAARKKLSRYLEENRWSLKVYKQNRALGYPWLSLANEKANIPSKLTLALAYKLKR